MCTALSFTHYHVFHDNRPFFLLLFCFFSSAFRFSFEHKIRTRVSRTPAQREENVLSKDVVPHISMSSTEKSDDDGEKFSVSMLVRCLEPLSAAIKKNFSRIAPSLNAGSAHSAHVNLANSTLDLAKNHTKKYSLPQLHF